MAILEELKNRRAIRNYETKEIPHEIIEGLLEAATWAPNDRLREPWSFYVVQGEAKRRYEDLAEQYLQERFPTKPNLIQSSLEVVRSTPLMIIVTSDIVPNDVDASEDNEYATCCAIHSMWLAAKEFGLGLVWRTRGVGLVRDERLLHFIGNPSNKKVIGTIFAGYPKQGQENTITKRTHYSEKTVWL